MKTRILAIAAIVLFLVSCSTVPLTGRKQLNMIPSNELMSMSYQQYGDFLKENPPVNNTPDALMVKKVGTNIQHAVEQYLANNKMSNLLDGYRWEFNLVNDNQVNAWCMPGGKVVVYQGILPVTKNETGLAVVMGHEIAHAIAKHSNERMTHQLGLQMGGMALSQALSEKKESTQQIAMAVFGIGSQVGIMLPYSRSHETEADELGLYFMAMAGYDPVEAPKFWERMLAAGKSSTPEFLSTHPDPENRIKHLNEIMPKALEYYHQTSGH